MSDSLVNARRDYSKAALEEANLPSSPFVLLKQWVDEALGQKIPDANAMDLATIDPEGFPTSRIVLLRMITETGLQFFTNYQSDKAQDLERSPKASLNFFWKEYERQIRLRGVVEKATAADSDAYFASRPRESQIGAWSSPQSKVIKNREELDQMVAQKTAQWAQSKVIPRPPFWGGYVFRPDRFEFWQGRPSRLHDRMRCRVIDGQWRWERLAP